MSSWWYSWWHVWYTYEGSKGRRDRIRKVEIWYVAETTVIILRTTTYESNNQPYMFNTLKIRWIVTRAFEQASQMHVSTSAAIFVTTWSVKLQCVDYWYLIIYIFKLLNLSWFLSVSLLLLITHAIVIVDFYVNIFRNFVYICHFYFSLLFFLFRIHWEKIRENLLVEYKVYIDEK